MLGKAEELDLELESEPEVCSGSSKILKLGSAPPSASVNDFPFQASTLLPANNSYRTSYLRL